MSSILAACGGFLLAVLWMDLMFDVQVLRHRRRDPELPEAVLASIAAYYRRVTTTARPMGHLVGAVMAATVVALAVQIAVGDAPRWLAPASLVLCGVPILLAGVRVYPNAVRLASRVDTPGRQSALARSICRDHLLCLAGILAFVALQLAACGSGPRPSDFEVGMAREEVVAAFGEPQHRESLVKSEAAVFGPIESFWSSVPLGSRVEIWSYPVSGGSVELYFVDDAPRVQGTGFAAEGAVY